MMEAARTSETLVNFYQTTRRYNPEDSHLLTHRRENLKSYFAIISCSSPYIIRMIKLRMMRWVGHVACMGEMRNTYKILAGKSEGKRPLGGLRLRWEDKIKINFREISMEDMDCINLVQDRGRLRAVVNTVMNL
jgi:hypothetical protein